MKAQVSYKDIRIEVTGRCNLRCVHCHAADRSAPEVVSRELTTQEILQIITEASEMGIDEFELIGGEPFMHPKIFLIIDACKGTVNICTNGLFFTDHILVMLSERRSKLRDFCISLDGTAAHALIRSGSRAEDVLRGIRRLKAALPEARVLVQTTCTALNMHELLDMYKVLKESDVLPHTWSINMFWMAGRGVDNYRRLQITDLEELMQIFAEIIITHRNDGRPFVLNIYNVYNSLIADNEHEEYLDYLQMTLDTHPCEYHKDKLCVRSDGTVEFCNSLHCISADYRESGTLARAVASPVIQSFYELRVSDLVGCSKCRFLPLCGGGCRGEALTHENDILQADRMACRMMALVEKFIMPILTESERRKYQSLINPEGEYPSGSI